jgi:predicted DNA-binding transcriptional regulator AlpA
MGKRLLNVKELAEYLGTTPSTVYTWLCLHKVIPENCIKRIGRSVKFDLVKINEHFGLSPA